MTTDGQSPAYTREPAPHLAEKLQQPVPQPTRNQRIYGLLTELVDGVLETVALEIEAQRPICIETTPESRHWHQGAIEMRRAAVEIVRSAKAGTGDQQQLEQRDHVNAVHNGGGGRG